MLTCKIATVLDLAVSARTTVKTDATVNFMDLGNFREEAGILYMKRLMFYLVDLWHVRVICSWTLKIWGKKEYN